MTSTSPRQQQLTGLSRLRLFWALSRTPHALLDMATPGFAAMLWLGTFPPLKVIVLGLLTVFAGYTSVYALNDVLDHRVDRQRLEKGGTQGSGHDLDAVLVCHPIAKGLLSFREGVTWVMAWAILALSGAYMLNPACALIFLAGCALEVFYCILWKVSPLRVIVSGAVKTSGGMAAVFAVDPHPSLSFLVALFLFLFFWEIGGQNIPNDWGDLEEDKRLQAKTIPVRLGLKRAKHFILLSLILAVAMNMVLLRVAPLPLELPYVIGSVLIGTYFLLAPAFRFYKSKERLDALALFNRASCYPVALLVMVAIRSLM